ncbi:BTB/POZ and MATH domain-containing protein 2 (Protein BTB-POZ AND MATH DOMAIN 2) (AtBPM2) [Durusdinium trenchii]|uniref:BTB/POZ and MATH domain-containing protein 2 (Protein BTB-POZ AND MATH DOMAIN 2) (AtBPM2) n=1 Tax=Durusdinium trenchii TaxID=1381693 RepID=A0ABP0S7V5_9DINO
MSSLDEIQSLINSAKDELAESRRMKEQVEHETVQALHRQQMRRQLDVIREAIHSNQCSIASSRAYRERIDSDSDGTFMPGKPRPAQDPVSCAGRPAGEVTTYSKVIDRHEYVWRIEGMSWLVVALKKRAQSVAAAEQPFLVGDTSFECVYHPRSGEIGDDNQRGSLAIIHNESGGITFRHQFFIKRSDGEYVQWGPTSEESHPLSDTLGRAFGPDVHEGHGPAKPVGIFGLTHEQLLRSEWVTGDALSVKIKVEVLPPEDGFSTKIVKTSRVDVPSSSICSHFRALFDSGKGADVTFMVKGEEIRAHSQILLARSEFFASELFGAMRESISKEIVVEDCEVDIFKAMLQFLYTDDFDHIQELVEHVCRNQKAVDSRNCNLAKVSAEIQLLHQLLQISHRYQVNRLQLWCEARLCNRMTVSEVSGVLCQARNWPKWCEVPSAEGFFGL